MLMNPKNLQCVPGQDDDLVRLTALSEGGIISEGLGHSSIATTRRYLNHINPKQVIDAMKNREW